MQRPFSIDSVFVQLLSTVYFLPAISTGEARCGDCRICSAVISPTKARLFMAAFQQFVTQGGLLAWQKCFGATRSSWLSSLGTEALQTRHRAGEACSAPTSCLKTLTISRKRLNLLLNCSRRSRATDERSRPQAHLPAAGCAAGAVDSSYSSSSRPSRSYCIPTCRS